LNPEAYIIADNTKEQAICHSIEAELSSLADQYVKLISKKLIGMFLVIYVRKPLLQFVSNVLTESTGTGILGVMGNKGAVAVRLKVYDSFLTFVNSHLAADTLMVDRRNQDFADISKRISFQSTEGDRFNVTYPWIANVQDTINFTSSCSKGTNPLRLAPSNNQCSIYDTDHLIWMGDLNYRVSIEEADAKIMLDSGVISDLLSFDQLKTEKASFRVFVGFEEQEIRFPPTYKYDVGTSNFDSRYLDLRQ
jgi:hypothetical protein